MDWIKAIIEAIKAFFSGLPILEKWRRKLEKEPIQKEEKIESEIRKEREDFKKTGRPKWN